MKSQLRILVFMFAAIGSIGCSDSVHYRSAFWPGFRGKGKQCVPEYQLEIETVVSRFQSGTDVEQNLEQNIRNEISSFDDLSVSEILTVRQVSPYAVLAHVRVAPSDDPSDWLFLVGCEDVVEIVGYYAVPDIDQMLEVHKKE